MLFMQYDELLEAKVVIAGWGIVNNSTYPRMLQTVKINIILKENCASTCCALTGQKFVIDQNHLCTVGNPYALIITVSISIIIK
jgi:hypothetical protein